MPHIESELPNPIESELNYLKYTGQRPVNYAIKAPPGVPQRSGLDDPRRVRIFDARRDAEPPTLDRNGFQLVNHHSAVDNFYDLNNVWGVYFGEAIELIKRVTGASHAHIFDQERRCSLHLHGEEGWREPIRRVHNDHTFTSAPRRIRDHLSQTEADMRLKQRHAIINLWRPTEGPVENAPLAFCDARTIRASDLIPSDLVFEDKVGETYALVYNPEHRWFYYPRVTLEEVLLFKIYDSKAQGTARLQAHTAFDDPMSKPGSAPRRSLEVRMLVFWDEDVGA